MSDITVFSYIIFLFKNFSSYSDYAIALTAFLLCLASFIYLICLIVKNIRKKSNKQLAVALFLCFFVLSPSALFFVASYKNFEYGVQKNRLAQGLSLQLAANRHNIQMIASPSLLLFKLDLGLPYLSDDQIEKMKESIFSPDFNERIKENPLLLESLLKASQNMESFDKKQISDSELHFVYEMPQKSQSITLILKREKIGDVAYWKIDNYKMKKA
jgi:hypothetical protein